MSYVPLEEALDEGRFGGKAVGLAMALRAGLQVPPGLALPVELVDAIAGSSAAEDIVDEMLDHLGGGTLAVRSSAVGEDSEGASFAGQHLTRLNVTGREQVIEAIRDVRESGRTDSALAYRRRMDLEPEPRVAVVVQRMIDAERAGVLFTVNPVTGADERVIEGSWGLGEAVVGGLVTPDRWRMRRGGEVIEQTLGEKDVEIVRVDGGTAERPVEPARMDAFCLGASDLAALEKLAAGCERFFDGPSDIEWGFNGERLFLLQRRAVTR